MFWPITDAKIFIITGNGGETMKRDAKLALLVFVSILVDIFTARNIDPIRLLWVHTPKTGSSFCLNLQHDQCYDLWSSMRNLSSTMSLTFRNGCAEIIGFQCKIDTVVHGPLPLNSPNNKVVMIFREPKSRIISSFTNFAHTEGMNKQYEKDLRSRMLKVSRSLCGRQIGGVKTECTYNARLYTYASDQATKGCVVKTLNGIWCMNNEVILNTAMVELAIQRIKQFYFVGIFEDWDNMLTKFYIKRSIPLSETTSVLDRAHVRKTEYKFNVTSLMDNYTDPFDGAVYKEAELIASFQ